MGKYKFDKDNHLHASDGKPLMGTSTVVGVIAKPLTWWAAGLAVGKLGWINSKIKIGNKYVFIPKEERINAVKSKLDEIKKMSPDEFLKLLDEGYKAHSVKLTDSAKDGTDLHAELERYVKWHMAGKSTVESFAPRIDPFIKWVDKKVKRFLYSEGNCHSLEIWCGGISDVGAELTDGSYAIIDFKSSKEAYVTQFIQTGGYDIQIMENGITDDEGNVVWRADKPFTSYIIVPFGADVIEPVIRTDVAELREAFRAATVLHKIVSKE